MYAFAGKNTDIQQLFPTQRGESQEQGQSVRLYNPIYHIKQAAVDIKALRHGFDTLGKPQHFTSHEQLTRVLHGRLLLAASIAIPATIIGIVVGWLVQVNTGSIPAGLIANLVVANILGAVGLEVLWAWLSRDVYKARDLHGFAMFRAIFGDMAKVHLCALVGVLLINALSMGLTTYVLENIHHWQPKWNLNRFVPASLISPIIGWLLLDAPFIRYMNDLYGKHSELLSRKYCDIIDEPGSVCVPEGENAPTVPQVTSGHQADTPHKEAATPRPSEARPDIARLSRRAAPPETTL